MDQDELRDTPIREPRVTDYDRVRRLAYLRLLDADAARADWREAARLVLGLDVEADAERAHRIWAVHLDRARWMARHGYRDLLGGSGEG